MLRCVSFNSSEDYITFITQAVLLSASSSNLYTENKIASKIFPLYYKNMLFCLALDLSSRWAVIRAVPA